MINTYFQNKKKQMTGSTVEVEGYPLVLENSKGKNLKDYKIYGYSKQDGTPTPETPIEIESVGNKTSNMTNLENVKVPSSTPYTQFEFNNFLGTLELKSTPSTFDYSLLTVDELGLEVGKTYYYSGNIIVSGKKTTNQTTVAFCLGINSGTNYIFTKDGSKNVDGYFTYNGESDARFRMYFNFGSSEPAQVRFEKIYVSEVKNEFEPYGYKIPVKASGKNLFNIKNISDYLVTNQFIEFYEDYSGFIMLATAFNNGNSIGKLSNLCPKLKVGDTFRFNFESNAYRQGQDVNYFYLNKYGNTIVRNKTYVCTQKMLDSDVYAYRGEVENAYIKNIQFELGTTTTDYEPYVEPTVSNIYIDEPLRKIGDYADYIDFENKKVVRRINKVNLRDYEWFSNNGTPAIYYTHLEEDYLTVGNLNNCLCNIFNGKSISSSNDNIGIQVYSTGVIRVRPDLTIYDTIEKWQEYVNNNESYLLYKLATSDDTETIELPNIPTFKGTNIITTDTNIEASNMWAKYIAK